MSICESGVNCKTQAKKISIDVPNNHPLIKLSQALPWRNLVDLILPDLKQTKAGCWWRGRKLRVRIQLGVYLLQQLYNKTDRQMEYDVKDNAAYQIFCGHGIVNKWHAPDHTKIEEFRSRLSSDTQQQLANEMAKHAVNLGFADPKHVDIDSTIQEANMNYPADSCLLKKLGMLASKAARFLNKTLETCIRNPIEVNTKKISTVARKYFFLPKKAEKSTKNEKLTELLQVVKTEIAPVIRECENVGEDFIKNIRWNYRNTILQIKESAKKYLKDVKQFLMQGCIVSTKRLSFHLKEVVCFSKGKPGRKYQFGRAFQLGRIGGNFIFVEKCNDTRMNDKENLSAVIKTHAEIFNKKACSVGTDKGYYSQKNEKLLAEIGVDEIAIQRPHNIKRRHPKPLTKEREEELVNRRSGIEPLIGHLKQKGQLGRSRMKSDKTIEDSGYTAVLGFNMRQIIRHQKPSHKKKIAC